MYNYLVGVERKAAELEQKEQELKRLQGNGINLAIVHGLFFFNLKRNSSGRMVTFLKLYVKGNLKHFNFFSYLKCF